MNTNVTEIRNQHAAEAFCNVLAWTGCENAILVVQDHKGKIEILTHNCDQPFLEVALAETTFLADPSKTK